MLKYVLFPVIGGIVAMQACRQVHSTTGNSTAAGAAGLLGFLFCFWASGHLLYGSAMAAALMALAIIAADSKEPS